MKTLLDNYTLNLEWDNEIPNREYFKQLFSLSKKQIIWGGNYFDLPPTQCFVFWDKMAAVPNFSDGALAWTKIEKEARKFRYAWNGLSDGMNWEK